MRYRRCTKMATADSGRRSTKCGQVRHVGVVASALVSSVARLPVVDDERRRCGQPFRWRPAPRTVGLVVTRLSPTVSRHRKCHSPGGWGKRSPVIGPRDGHRRPANLMPQIGGPVEPRSGDPAGPTCVGGAPRGIPRGPYPDRPPPALEASASLCSYAAMGPRGCREATGRSSRQATLSHELQDSIEQPTR